MCGVMLSGSEESTPSIIYHCVLRGLERLLLSEQLCRLDAESLVKLSVDRVNVHSPHRAMAALGLMLTCMYTGAGCGVRGPRDWPGPTCACQLSATELQTVRICCPSERDACSFLDTDPTTPPHFRKILEQGLAVAGSRPHCCVGFRAQPREQVCRLTTAPHGPTVGARPWAAELSCHLISQDLSGFVELPSGFKAWSSEQVTVHNDLFQGRRKSAQAEPQTPAPPPRTVSP